MDQTPLNVAVITPNLAHYRRELFRLLDSSSDVTIHHYSDKRDRSGIASISVGELERFNPVKNVYLGPFMWQRGVARAATVADHDAYIFTGDVNYLSTWVASAIARIRGRDVYHWTIGWHRPEGGIKRLIRRSFYSLSTAMMVYGDHERDLSIQHGVPAHKVHVIYNSVTATPSTVAADLKMEGKEFAVGVIARLTAAKKINLLLDAVAILRKQKHGLRIVIIGDGPEKNKLQNLAKMHDLDVEFLGALHDEPSIARFYARVLATVIPSAAGLSTIQSLAHGVPVITDDDIDSQMPEASAVVPGLTGERFRSGSADSLAVAIESVLRKVQHDRVQIAQSCLEEVNARWSPEVQAKHMLRVLNEYRRLKAEPLGGSPRIVRSTGDRIAR